MHSYLMCSACFKDTFDKCILSEPFKYVKMRNRLTSAEYNSHFLSVRRISADRLIYCAAVLFYIAVYKCNIFTHCFAFFKLFRQLQMCLVIFCDYQKSRRVLINSMHNTGTDYTVNCRKFVTAMVDKTVYKRTALVTRCRMNAKSLRFVHNDNITVLIYDIKRYIFRLNRKFFGFGYIYRYFLRAQNLIFL